MTMTLQQMFDTAYRGVIAQGKPSVSGAGSCMYRGPNGTKCGVGQIMTDDEYHPAMDKGNYSVPNIVEARSVSIFDDDGAAMPFKAPQWLLNNAEFLTDLQEAHDNAERDQDFIKQFKINMKRVAKKHNLILNNN